MTTTASNIIIVSFTNRIDLEVKLLIVLSWQDSMMIVLSLIVPYYNH